MKMFRRYPRRDSHALHERAQNVNDAMRVLHDMRIAGQITDANYNTLYLAIQHEIEYVARELRA